jgi:hypothetical protein
MTGCGSHCGIPARNSAAVAQTAYSCQYPIPGYAVRRAAEPGISSDCWPVLTRCCFPCATLNMATSGNGNELVAASAALPAAARHYRLPYRSYLAGSPAFFCRTGISGITGNAAAGEIAGTAEILRGA